METFFSKRINNPITINQNKNKVTIETDRLILKTLNQIPFAELKKNYSSLFTCPENVPYYANGQPMSPEQVDNFLAMELDRKEKGDLYGSFAVYQKDSNRFTGNLGLHFRTDEFAKLGSGHPDAAELSYILMKDSWGKGFGTELSILGKKYAKFLKEESFQKPKEIIATVHPFNTASLKILKRALKETEDEQIIKYGNPRLIFFKILKENPKKIAEGSNAKSFFNFAAI